MNSPNAGLKFAGTLFGLFALVHIWRLIKGSDVVIGSHHIPLWFSAVAAGIGLILFVWMWKLACDAKHKSV